MIIIFTYNRPDMLLRLLRECPAGEQVIAIDDGSAYDPSEHMKLCHYIRTQHWGKMGFWQKWQYAFDLCRNSTDEYFTFLADDMREVEWHRLARMPDKLYAQNLLTMPKRIREWTRLGGQDCEFNGEPHWTCGYVDCAYQTNRMTLEHIGWVQPVVDYEWFMAGPSISSGVGHHQSWRFVHNHVPMYMPKQTLSRHGDHESQMHPTHRKETPIVV